MLERVAFVCECNLLQCADVFVTLNRMGREVNDFSWWFIFFERDFVVVLFCNGNFVWFIY